ncbi:Oligopeptide transporter OPT superfamily [Metarhizium album ARSEF 1941]|uniref:Oligopeptide transporter OPT superfamily n=1 Tax=Metarhizium album (strain ARSEF 1941) TaxID=1081103 RepID=A0A0B2X0V9_METAS|nr:Oligopeptide transporter OPT superfamily [Metarhizium album ARSEF 1941]KHN99272.1 Oligopeptide transporter OPT superfamily [Metarhizium album ARSEF 1941]
MNPPKPMIEGNSFTLRSVVVGLAVGTVICAANVYFGLQTGWVSIMSMPASLMGFGIFKMLRPHLSFPFSPVENVLLQSVACGMAIMPLGCGFVGVIPAMNYLLYPTEEGPIYLSTTQLIIWSLGLCYFGVVFAVPFGFSTAVLISVLHGKGPQSSMPEDLYSAAQGGFASLVPRTAIQDDAVSDTNTGDGDEHDILETQADPPSEWASNMGLLLICFSISGFFTVLTYFLPVLRNLPIFGTVAANTWLWTLNPSLAYVGQGVIMGTETTLHMTLGAVVGWGFLSPLAKLKSWAPGPVDDWEHGSKGWIIWVSLAIMLVDAVVSLGYLASRSFLLPSISRFTENFRKRLQNARRQMFEDSSPQYSLLQDQYEHFQSHTQGIIDNTRTLSDDGSDNIDDVEGDDDAPADQRVGGRLVIIGLIASIILCIGTTHFVFGDLVPLYATVIAVLIALVLSVMGVRSLGETDLNPVSGISKLAQLFFALIIPHSNKSSVLINLVAGAVGALQAGDLMQDLKTGHLLGAAPNAQFWGQVIGATAGATLSAFIYQIYASVYTIPGDLFQVPTAYVWIFTARLVTGQGLPYMAKEWALGAGIIFAITTLIRTAGVDKWWRPYVPGGIAVAVGIYNVPSFTLARAAGGVVCWYWTRILRRPNTQLIILASGFILGEGFLSIANLILQGLKVPHLS